SEILYLAWLLLHHFKEHVFSSLRNPVSLTQNRVTFGTSKIMLTLFPAKKFTNIFLTQINKFHNNLAVN
ncbi:MAG TPA: hypothetical protein PK106_09100, partial [Bacteroidales bacterium]|nr:hypothetical protein [Bacteroidales bacterium]